MKAYLSLREAAEKWGVSERRINQYCAEGRIPGAQRVGKAWAIPADAEKPGDPRRTRRQGKTAPARCRFRRADRPNKPYAPDEHGLCAGEVPETVEAMAPGPRRDIAMAEYTISADRRSRQQRRRKPTSQAPIWGARLSACLIYAYSNLTLKRTQRAEFALGELNASLASAGRAGAGASGGCGVYLFYGNGASATCRCRRKCPRPGASCSYCRRASGLCSVCPVPLSLSETGV